MGSNSGVHAVSSRRREDLAADANRGACDLSLCRGGLLRHI